MAKKKEQPVQDMDLMQAQLFARDLNELYRAERQKREELAEEKLVLEYKLRELSALNALFQSHLERRFEVEKAYNELVDGIKKLLKEKTSKKMVDSLKGLLAQVEARISEGSESSQNRIKM